MFSTRTSCALKLSMSETLDLYHRAQMYVLWLGVSIVTLHNILFYLNHLNRMNSHLCVQFEWCMTVYCAVMEQASFNHSSAVAIRPVLVLIETPENIVLPVTSRAVQCFYNANIQYIHFSGRNALTPHQCTIVFVIWFHRKPADSIWSVTEPWQFLMRRSAIGVPNETGWLAHPSSGWWEEWHERPRTFCYIYDYRMFHLRTMFFNWSQFSTGVSVRNGYYGGFHS